MSDPGSTPTRFAQLLQEYMWSQRPPLNGHKLARQLGIGTTTVYGWLNGVKPDMSLLPTVADGTGIPVNTLLVAAGYPLLRDAAEVDAVFDFIAQSIRESSEYPDEDERKRALIQNEQWRAAYKESLDDPPPLQHDPEHSGSEPRMRAIV